MPGARPSSQDKTRKGKAKQSRRTRKSLGDLSKSKDKNSARHRLSAQLQNQATSIQEENKDVTLNHNVENTKENIHEDDKSISTHEISSPNGATHNETIHTGFIETAMKEFDIDSASEKTRTDSIIIGDDNDATAFDDDAKMLQNQKDSDRSVGEPPSTVSNGSSMADCGGSGCPRSPPVADESSEIEAGPLHKLSLSTPTKKTGYIDVQPSTNIQEPAGLNTVQADVSKDISSGHSSDINHQNTSGQVRNNTTLRASDNCPSNSSMVKIQSLSLSDENLTLPGSSRVSISSHLADDPNTTGGDDSGHFRASTSSHKLSDFSIDVILRVAGSTPRMTDEEMTPKKGATSTRNTYQPSDASFKLQHKLDFRTEEDAKRDPDKSFEAAESISKGNYADKSRQWSEEDLESAESSSGQQEGAKMRMAPRTKYTPEQKAILNYHFARDPYPSSEDLEKLSKKVDISEEKLKVWYQNKRASIVGSRQPKTMKQQLQDQQQLNISVPRHSVQVPLYLQHTPYQRQQVQMPSHVPVRLSVPQSMNSPCAIAPVVLPAQKGSYSPFYPQPSFPNGAPHPSLSLAQPTRNTPHFPSNYVQKSHTDYNYATSTYDHLEHPLIPPYSPPLPQFFRYGNTVPMSSLYHQANPTPPQFTSQPPSSISSNLTSGVPYPDLLSVQSASVLPMNYSTFSRNAAATHERVDLTRHLVRSAMSNLFSPYGASVVTTMFPGFNQTATTSNSLPPVGVTQAPYQPLGAISDQDSSSNILPAQNQPSITEENISDNVDDDELVVD